MKNATLGHGDETMQYNIRKSNYEGNNNQTYKSIDKGTFGRDQVKYSENGGYSGKGGFIHYFQPNLTHPEAVDLFYEMVEDGLVDEKFISLTLDFIFYNENFKIGVYIAYEFSINNAGKLEVFTTSLMYQSSVYQLDDGATFPFLSLLLHCTYFI